MKNEKSKESEEKMIQCNWFLNSKKNTEYKRDASLQALVLYICIAIQLNRITTSS